MDMLRMVFETAITVKSGNFFNFLKSIDTKKATERDYNDCPVPPSGLGKIQIGEEIKVYRHVQKINLSDYQQILPLPAVKLNNLLYIIKHRIR